jgi:hypothetical protein
MNVSFSSPINCAVTPPGGVTTASTQCGILSAPANVTASISADADTSGGALTVLSVTSFILETRIETPGPGELPPGVQPRVPVKVQVPVEVAQTNGVTPLAVASGEYVVVTIQFAPTASTPVVSTATLLIHGDTWNPVSIPITAPLGQITVEVPTIVVDQGESVTVDVAVTLVAGAPTHAVLLIDRDGSADAPNVTVTVSSSPLLLPTGMPAHATLTVTADSTLAAGKYSWNLAVWSYNNTLSFSVPVTITVAVVVPYVFIKSKLDGNVIDIADASTKSGAGLDAFPQKTSSNDNQLWHFLPDPAGSGYFYIVSKLNGNVIDVQKASTAPGAPLDAFPRKDGADNQLWYFVSDPEGSGFCFIVNKLNGNVLDVQKASTAAGAPLDAYPVKFIGYDNQLWKVVNGSFPSVVQTAQTPKGGLVQGRVNYFFAANSQALYGLSVTVKFTSDFASSANGYSFQLNCYSTIGPTVTTEVQQFVIYASPGSNQLVARIDTFAASDVELNRIDSNLAELPSSTIPKGYSFNITLNYYNGDSAIISGATYTLFDPAGNPVGSTAITIIGNSLLTNGQPATLANLAPLAALQLVIGGDYGGTLATLTGGAGTVTYNASVGLVAQATQPSFTLGDGRTKENANMLWGWVPWPWSISMQNDSLSVLQTFQVPAGGSAFAAQPAEMERTGHVLPPPDDRSFSRRVLPASGH